jgi:phenylpropionate dioxygenase-like ring-hydroxylating dioxygenase large terminal subunit
LVANGAGRFDGTIGCKIHGLAFHWDGRLAQGDHGTDLRSLEMHVLGGLLFARSNELTRGAAADPGAWFGGKPPHGLMPLGPVREAAVAADWKVIVEQWLESAAPAEEPNPATAAIAWTVRRPGSASGWSLQRYRGLAGSAAAGVWHERFVAPAHLVQWRPDGVSIMQVIPAGPGRCRVRRFDYAPGVHGRNACATAYLAERLRPWMRRATLAAAESAQTGMIDFGYCARPREAIAPAVSWFRRQIVARVPALALDRPPIES